MPSGSYKDMNDRYLTHDPDHQRDHRYGPSDLATGTGWIADTTDSWMRSEGGEVADILSQLLVQGGVESVAGAITKSGAIDARILSAIIQEISDR